MKPENDYYAIFYKTVQRRGFQGWGNSLVDRLIESKARRKENFTILEVGASSGEHLTFVKKEPRWQEYVCLDLHPGTTDPTLYQSIINRDQSKYENVKFVEANAESIPFQDSTFDLVIATCLLAHVEYPEKVMLECRRVAKSNGQIIIGMPCDPGLINRFIKNIYTFPRLRKAGIENPELVYAREHRNPIHNLITLSRHVFSEDELKESYFPIGLKTWNLNMIIVLDCKIKKDSQDFRRP